jgi:hypothetical protein
MEKLGQIIRHPKNSFLASTRTKSRQKSYSKDQDPLCERCSRLDLDWLFAETASAFDSGREGIGVIFEPSESIFEVRFNALRENCPLCGIFAHCAPFRGPGSEAFGSCRYTLLKCSTQEIFDAKIFQGSGSRVPKNLLKLCDSQYAIQPHIYDFEGQSFVAQYLASDYDIKADNPLQAVNFTILEQWLSNCREQHPLCKGSETMSSKVPVFMIDCTSRKVLRSKPGMRYAALSYVWGSPASKTQKIDLPHLYLSSRMPKVVEDAITVTSKLGMNYLWVDRYCISEEDKEVKHMQIKFMDQIYSHAEITIISLTNGPDQGLPGVNETIRPPRQSVIVGKYRFTATMRYPMDVIEESIWNDRAWVRRYHCQIRTTVKLMRCGRHFRKHSYPSVSSFLHMSKSFSNVTHMLTVKLLMS